MIRCAEHHWGREWNAGDNLNCGTGEGLLPGYILLSLFLRTVSNITARIPLPTRFSSLRSGGPPSPREKVKQLRRKKKPPLFLSGVFRIYRIPSTFRNSRISTSTITGRVTLLPCFNARPEPT